MAQHDQIIDNGPGLAVRTDINAAIAALFSSNSGTVEPAVKVPGQLWFDTSVPGQTTLKIRDIVNSAWLPVNLSSSGSDQLFNANVILNHIGATGKYLAGQQNGVMRWAMYPGHGAESGSNSGSDFQFIRYNDAGSPIDTPIQIRRSDGALLAALIGATAATITTLTLTNALPVASGGTGANNAASARANLGLGSMAEQSASNYYTTSQVYHVSQVYSAAQSDARYATNDPAGGIGTVIMGYYATNNGYLNGVAGSALVATNTTHAQSSGALSGTWRIMGFVPPGGGVTCFQRIA